MTVLFLAHLRVFGIPSHAKKPQTLCDGEMVWVREGKSGRAMFCLSEKFVKFVAIDLKVEKLLWKENSLTFLNFSIG